MTRLVEVPTRFDDRTFDQFARSCGEPGDERLLIDAHTSQWASPFGLLGLLTAGQWIKEKQLPRPLFNIPSDREVAHYWARTGFFEFAQEYFELHGRVPRAASGSTDALLDVTPVRGTADVHLVVGHVQDRSAAILAEVGLEPQATLGFAMALSEGCQNIVEHAGTGGWVAVQAYNWKRRLGRRVVMIAVADAGVGFRQSLQSSQAERWGDRWGDAAALEAAVFQGMSRFPDPGRGQGLAGMRRYVERWDGKLSLRSGTARLSIVPSWDPDDPIEDRLPPFPGAQVLVIIPGKKDVESGGR
jgi:anti-sigma regulatory factor (Ser/Thr protein kinase)